MNISKTEQRMLHVLAQGGRIVHTRDNRGKITQIVCCNRDGFVLADCTMAVFMKLRAKRLISSKQGAPYRVTAKGLAVVRPRSETDERKD